MEDVNMSDAELRELLLPSDLVVPDEYTIPIAELTGVLQTDLVMPVTKSDQMVSSNTIDGVLWLEKKFSSFVLITRSQMILNTYGHGDGEVDVRRLLSDAGKLLSYAYQQMFFGTHHQLIPLMSPNNHS